MLVLIPAILGVIVFTALFIHAENENDDYVAKIWLYIVAAIFAMITVCLTEKCIEFANTNTKIDKVEEVKTYYNDDFF